MITDVIYILHYTHTLTAAHGCVVTHNMLTHLIYQFVYTSYLCVTQYMHTLRAYRCVVIHNMLKYIFSACMYTYIHICIYAYIHIHICIYAYTHTHIYMYIDIYVFTFISTWIIYNTCTQIQKYIHTHISIYIDNTTNHTYVPSFPRILHVTDTQESYKFLTQVPTSTHCNKLQETATL